MRKLAGAGLAAVLSVFAIMLVAPSAQAYPAPGVTVSVSDQTVVEGSTFTLSGHADVNCAWTASFVNQAEAGAGHNFSATFTAPHVTKKTTYDATVRCTYAGTAGHAGAAVMVHDQTVTRTIPITVVPAGANAAGPASGAGTGALPNTGGPNAALLGGAIALIVVGAGTVLYTRRRHAHA